jgi:hypothetical protein
MMDMIDVATKEEWVGRCYNAEERLAKAQAQVKGFQKRISELVALLDQQLGTPCEGIRHAQEMEESQALIAQLKAALEWYAAHVADCRKLGTVGDIARGKLDRDGGTKARAALKAKP